jgi:hypothetical protein
MVVDDFVMSTPAVVVDDKLAIAAAVLDRATIAAWLAPAATPLLRLLSRQPRRHARRARPRYVATWHANSATSFGAKRAIGL